MAELAAAGYHRFVAFLTRIWGLVRGRRQPPSTVELLTRAERHRRDGRFEEASALVQEALARDPRSVFGHLLDAYIHAASRRSDQARIAFDTVLRIDPYQPRALLGLARIAFERGEGPACRELLERALRVYPDFPEARALLGVVVSVGAPRAAAEPAARGAAPPALARLALPVGSRECLIVDSTGRVLFAHGAAPDGGDAAAHLRRIARIASATLERAGLGPLRSAVIESGEATTFLRGDDRLLLSLGLPRDVATGVGQRHTESVWQRCLEATKAPA